MDVPIHREWMRQALAEAEQAPATRDVPVGAIVVRDGIHLFHLFVAERFQRRGWARQLWLHALSQAHQGTRMTVNATLFARGFYERMGFIATGPLVQTHGIAFVPMVHGSARG